MPDTPLDRAILDDDRIALFIDGANVYSTARALAFDMDYRKLLDEFKARGKLIRASYYTAVMEEQDFSPIRPLVDWLDYHGYCVITKPAREFQDAQGRRRIKGNMDIEIAVDMMEAAAWADHLFLFSGDGDFAPLLASVQRRGARVSVVSTLRSNPPMIADELRRQADNFIDFADILDLIGRPPRAGAPLRHEGDADDEHGSYSARR
jgi:uncharacterized LabA/DUF88 family protein